MDKYILKVWRGLRNEITFILSPTEKWGTKTEYTKLKKFLHKDGYLRIAPFFLPFGFYLFKIVLHNLPPFFC